MEIRFLADVPGHVDTLARWHHGEWGALYADWSLADAAAELRDHATRRTRPTTLVALDGDALVGSVSLVDEDAPEFADRGDAWLASLYVVPAARGRGLGAALAQALAAHATALGLDRLWLHPPPRRFLREARLAVRCPRLPPRHPRHADGENRGRSMINFPFVPSAPTLTEN